MVVDLLSLSLSSNCSGQPVQTVVKVYFIPFPLRTLMSALEIKNGCGKIKLRKRKWRQNGKLFYMSGNKGERMDEEGRKRKEERKRGG